MRNNHSLPFFKGQTINKIKCHDVSNLGFGVFKHEDFIIFAQGAIYDEVADLEITEVKKNFALAKVTKIIEGSEERIQNILNYQTVTGGSKYQEYTYEKQLEIKQRQMSDVFQRKVKIIGSKRPFHYRNKSEFFYANKRLNMYSDSNKLVPVKTSKLSHQRINELLEPTLEALNNNPRANVTSVIFRYSAHEDKIMLILVSEKENKYHLKIAQEIVGYSNIVKSVILNIGKSKNYLFNNEEKVLYGEDYLIDVLFNKQFKITSKSFYQINQKQTEALYQTAIDFARLKETDNVADLYCGVGTIGIIISDYVNHVLGVELVSEAVAAAKDNINLNEINNYEVIEHDLNKDISILDNIDVAIVDPPRSGLSDIMIKNLCDSNLKRIVYISCNPYTQKRDLSTFEKNGYILKDIKAVDMFSYTHHIESVILLEK